MRSRTSGSPAALLEAVGRGADLVLMDLNYTRDTTSGAEGLDLLRRLRERHPLTPVIVMTAWGSIELAVEAMRQGARSFVLKPWDNGPLQQLVAAELGEAHRRQSPAPDAGGPRDLAVARRVQAELLPRTKPPLATLDYAGLCLQAGAVGGDLLRLPAPGPGLRGVRAGRRLGQGGAAPLSSWHTSRRCCAARPLRALDDLPGFLADVNAQFYATTAPEHFATLFFGVYDDAGRRLRYANCGHNPPVLLAADGSVLHLSPTAPAVGLHSGLAGHRGRGSSRGGRPAPRLLGRRDRGGPHHAARSSATFGWRRRSGRAGPCPRPSCCPPW